MALVDRIDMALVERKLDPETFERAACALLQSRYPWLSPVEAGRDLGRDADIYRPLPEDPESRGRLLATTGDAFANLKRSHKRWGEEGLRVDQLLIACSNNLTGTTRKKIDQYCLDNSLPLPEYYGRDWLVNALLSNTEWREALTGVRGRLESLRPASFGHAESQTPFVGRDDILGHLQSTIGEGRDVVLEGVPGVGKTRLLGELGNEVSFVEPHARTYLAEDLLAFSPKCVVVDDAHLHAGLLSELSSLRTQEGLAFVIVASTWPDHASETATVLPSSARIRLDLLPRTEIDVVVQAAGVTSVRARQLVLDQAEGRPGWALALCSALVEGNGDHVASGATLLDQVERYLRGASDSATTMDAMALIAALGGATQDDLERISQLVGVPAAVLLNAVHAIATNGLLEEAHGRWHLQSALCAPIVSRWFFGKRKSRSWNSTLTAFAERAIDLTSMLLRAAAIQPLGEAGIVAHEWARALPPATHWDEPTMGLVRDYSRLDEEAAAFATHAAQEVLSSPRAVNTTPWGTVYDPMGIAARGLLTGCVYQWFNKDAVQALLTLAVGDDRARPQTTDHPMRVLGDLAHHLDPDRGSLFEVRELLLTYAVEWLAADPGAPGHWEVFCEAVRYAFAPAVEGNWTDPAGQRSITIASAVESSEHLQELTCLWGRVDGLLQGVAPDAVPAKAIVDVIELFEEWLRLAGGHTRGTAVPSATQRGAAATAAWAIYQTLLPFLHAHIGLALRTQKALDLAQRWDVLPPETIEPLVLDNELVLFAGRRDVWEDAEDWIQQRDQDCTQLAGLLLGLGPRDGTNRFVRLAQETELSGQVQEGGFVAMMAARLADEPAEWIPCACTAGSATMLHYMLREARQRGINVDATVVAASLRDPRLRGATVRAVLDGSQLDPVAEFVVASLDAGDSWLLDSLFTKAEADAVLHALLVHPVMEVRATASLAFAVGVKHGPGLPSEWADDWARAFLDADHTTIQGHSRWRLQEVLKALAEERPGLIADWFEQRLSMSEPAWSGARHSELEPIAGSLPSAERERLARLCASSVVNDKTMLRHLLGHDADLSAQLLEDGTLDAEDALETLSGERDQGVEILVPVLLAHGIAPKRIARTVCGSRSWEGKESDAIQKDIEWFTSLLERSPGLQPVCEAALADLANDLERSLGEEVDEAIRGWN